MHTPGGDYDEKIIDSNKTNYNKTIIKEKEPLLYLIK